MRNDFSAEFKREVIYNDKEWTLEKIWEHGKNCKSKEKGIFWRDAYDLRTWQHAIGELMRVRAYYDQKHEEASEKHRLFIREAMQKGTYGTKEHFEKEKPYRDEIVYWRHQRIEPSEKISTLKDLGQDKIRFHLETLPEIDRMHA